MAFARLTWRERLRDIETSLSTNAGKLYATGDMRAMQRGGIYELMCHRGCFDAKEVSDHRLLAHHDWEGEFNALTGASALAMLESSGVRLIGYRDPEIRDCQLVVRPEAQSGL